MIQLASALNFLHSRLVFHKDIKLENTLHFSSCFGQPIVKLTDFGIAISQQIDRHTTKIAKQGKCTASYMSPELEEYFDLDTE